MERGKRERGKMVSSWVRSPSDFIPVTDYLLIRKVGNKDVHEKSIPIKKGGRRHFGRENFLASSPPAAVGLALRLPDHERRPLEP